MCATIITIDADDQISSSRSDINTNFANLNNDKIETSAIDTDTTLSANSDDKIPSQKAVKAYIDAGGAANFPSDYVTTSAGVTDAGKGVKLNSNGKLDGSFAITPIVRVYTTSGSPHTWTKPSGLNFIKVQVQAAGGGGGGSSGTSSTSRFLGGGGGAGAYSEKIISNASLGSTETVTVGTGGGGGAGNAAGTTGGSSSFGSHIVCVGGGGGNPTRTSPGDSVAGGTATTAGDIAVPGESGQYGFNADSGTTSFSTMLNCGDGGSAHLGIGGKPTKLNGVITARAVSGYGAGGAGAWKSGNGDATGETGANGVIIVTEYYN